MADILLQENGSYLLQEDLEPILLESSLINALNNFEFASSVGDGMSFTEKIR